MSYMNLNHDYPPEWDLPDEEDEVKYEEWVDESDEEWIEDTHSESLWEQRK